MALISSSLLQIEWSDMILSNVYKIYKVNKLIYFLSSVLFENKTFRLVAHMQ